MLGFGSISESPISSLSSFLFTIRGNSDIFVDLQVSGSVVLPIVGDSSTLIEIEFRSVATLSIKRIRKQVIATSVAKIIDSKGLIRPPVEAVSVNKNIYPI